MDKCATASGLPLGGSRPVEAQVQWLVLDLSSTSPSNVLHKNTPRILSQRLMIGPTVAEESLQIRKPMQYNDNNYYNISSSSSLLLLFHIHNFVLLLLSLWLPLEVFWAFGRQRQQPVILP